jgi:hypothetical protein
MVHPPQPVLAANTAFFITFGIFVLALVILAFLTLRWAIRQDRAGFKAWRQRQQARSAPTTTSTPTSAATPGEGDVPPAPGK